MSATGARILVVEDDRGIATMLERGLRIAGHRVTVADGAAAARTAWTAGAFDLVLLDVMLPDGDGIDLLAERRATGDEVPAVLLTAREEAPFIGAAGDEGAAAVEPLTSYSVGRVMKDFGQGTSSMGAIFTATNRRLEGDRLGFLPSAAYAGGFDWNHAWHKREWSFDGAIVATHNLGSAEAIDALQLSPARYYQRPDRRGFHRDPSRTSLTGYMAEASLAKLAGTHWRFSLTAQDYHPGFEINEVGFEGSTDMRGIAPLIGYVETKPGKFVRFRESFLFWNPSWNYDGDMTFNGVGALTFLQTKNFWGIFGRLDWRPPVIDDRLTRGGPVGVVPAQFGWGFELTSDSRKKHRFGMFMNRFTNSEGGWRQFFGPFVTLKPSPAASARATLT